MKGFIVGAEASNIWIRSYLEQRDSGGQNPERTQKQSKDATFAAGKKPSAPSPITLKPATIDF